MKGLVLSGGKGTRLRPITYTSAKQLVPVANKPVLFRVIEAIRDAGIDEIGIVIGDTGPEVRTAVGDGKRWGVRIEQFGRSSYNAQIVLKRVPNPQQYGVAELDEQGRIVRLTEKPREPRSNLALVGIYMFDQSIWPAVEAIKPSWRGELEITDAIQWLVEHGRQVFAYVHDGWWIDTGKKDDMLEANRLILEEMPSAVDGYIDRDSQLIGKVIVEKGAEIINSTIRGPAIIGEHTRIVNSYVGPFTSIYHHCLVEGSEIEHSIVLEHSIIRDLPHRLEDSLIGRYVEITRSPLKPRAYRLVLGDHSTVGVL